MQNVFENHEKIELDTFFALLREAIRNGRENDVDKLIQKTSEENQEAVLAGCI